MTSRPRPKPVPDYRSDQKAAADREGTKKAGYRTFNEWSNAGYRIIKGSKSHSRNSDGVCLFHESQVMIPDEDLKRKDAIWDSYEGDDDDDFEQEY